MSVAVSAASACPVEPRRRTQWLTLSAASEALERSPGAVKSIALSGAIRTQALPGSRILYSAADVDRLARRL